MFSKTIAPWLVRLARLAIVFAAAVAIHWALWQHEAHVASPFTLADARLVFPEAARIGHRDSRDAFAVFDGRNELIGYALTTSPLADDIIGYSGPSNLLIGLNPDGRVAAVKLVSSRDTPAHLAEINRSKSYWDRFSTWSTHEDNSTNVESVSGSTLTSLAMAEAVERRISGKRMSLRFPEPIQLEEVQALFPSAKSIELNRPRAGWIRVASADNALVGFVLRTSPQSDNVIGYAGPTEVIAAIGQDEKTVVAVAMRKSYDTPDYVDRVREDNDYLQTLAGRTIEDYANLDFKREGIEGVSGATQTSFAVAESLRQRMKVELLEPGPSFTWLNFRDIGLAGIVIGAIALCFSRQRKNRKLRTAWQLALVAFFGIFAGDLLSLALFAGWSRGGIPWQTAPALSILAAVALLVPWCTKRQVYCHYICPHGAAQEWLGRWKRLHIKISPRVSNALSVLPWALLLVGFALSVALVRFDLSQLEPFDTWSLKLAAVIPAFIGIVGLVASVFVPQGYCRFGCPSGALFKFVQSHGTNETFSARDWIAAGCVAVAMTYLAIEPFAEVNSPSADKAAKPIEFGGDGFGTTWRVKIRGSISPAETLREQCASELDRIESKFSSWRKTSFTTQFNSSDTTLAMELPPEFIDIVKYARHLSEKTAGAFDITVGPLVDAWGYGPTGRRDAPPSDTEIQSLLAKTGWQRLEINETDNSLRKALPEMQIDLGALLQGYSVDRIAALLDAQNVSEYLIEVGGELRAKGSWSVAIENPNDLAQPLLNFNLSDAALATSGVYSKSGKDSAAHILDPHTGRPVGARWILVSILAPTCLDADGWATALIASSDEAVAIAGREKLAAFFVDREGKVQATDAWNTELPSK